MNPEGLHVNSELTAVSIVDQPERRGKDEHEQTLSKGCARLIAAADQDRGVNAYDELF